MVSGNDCLCALEQSSVQSCTMNVWVDSQLLLCVLDPSSAQLPLLSSIITGRSAHSFPVISSSIIINLCNLSSGFSACLPASPVCPLSLSHHCISLSPPHLFHIHLQQQAVTFVLTSHYGWRTPQLGVSSPPPPTFHRRRHHTSLRLKGAAAQT